MGSRKAIWIENQKLLDKFNHFKIDNGKNSDISLKKLLDYWEVGHRSKAEIEVKI